MSPRERPPTCTVSRQGDRTIISWSAHPRSRFQEITRSFASTMGPLARLEGSQWIVGPAGRPALAAWLSVTFPAGCVQADDPELASAPARPRVAYDAYVRSEQWHQTRARLKGLRVIQQGGRPDPLCDGCGQRPGSQADHRSYEHLGNEFLFELLWLCASCHARLSQD